MVMEGKICTVNLDYPNEFLTSVSGYIKEDSTERDAADVVEGEPLQSLLEVDDSALVAGLGEEGEEAVGDLVGDGLCDEVLEQPGGELVASDLALEGLEVAVDGKDAVVEELAEDGVVARALIVVGEVGGEEVLEVQIPAGEAEGRRRGPRQHLDDPVVEAVAVAKEADEKYDVFVSFRGRDVRKNFISHLFHRLKRDGFHYFSDNDRDNIGEKIRFKIFRAIRSEMFALVLFSVNYAGSKWCLNELVQILKCKRKRRKQGHVVIPVFFSLRGSNRSFEVD
ncbi:hypothetical protein NL676_008097 [Syzygium grande]|nr:hypothetical protein NL676_008097 [Syzygium grande]